MIRFLQRLLHYVFARLLRKFWAPCPRCGHKFGGHEAHQHHTIIHGRHYRYVCGTCAKHPEARKQ
jgi:hypothetical protein